MAQRGILVHSFFAIGSRERELIEDRSAEGIFYAASPDIATASPHLGCAYLQPETHMNANLGLFGTTSFDFWGGAQLSVAPIAVADQPQNHGITTQAIPNDARYTDGSLWGMYGDASGPANQFGSQAAEAWAQGHTGSMTNVIGVIDTGIDYTHPDLYLNIWLNQREIPTTLRASLSDIDSDGLITFRDLNGAANASYVLDYNSNGRIDAGDLLNDSRWENGIDEDGNGYRDDLIGWDFVSNDNDPRDSDGHGTHVAGTIGALGGNGIGVVGVNWNVQLVPLQIFSSYGAFAGDTAAVNYFTSAAISARAAGSTENFVATNNSWGGAWYDQALLNAITAAAQQDILFIAAAGNDSSNNDAWPSYPDGYSTALITGYEAVISVASITNTGILSDFSNFGAHSVDIAAPGSDIWSTLPNGSYGSNDGTSMATPHVTAAIALYASLFPRATGAQIREALLASVTYTASANNLVASDGRLNIPAMLALAPPVTEFADWLDGTVGGDNLNGRGGNDTISAGIGDDTLDGGAGNDSITGSAGNDWASYASASGAITVDLFVGTSGGAAGSDYLLGIENLRGGAGNDRLFGDAGNNFLAGGNGADTLDGGLGNDTLDGESGSNWASYATANTDVTVDLVAGTSSGPNGDDILLNIENLRSGAGNDRLFGDAGNNFLVGGNGADTLDGGMGRDTLDGEAGINWISYASATSNVVVDLALGFNNDPHGSDSLLNFSHVLAGAGNDKLFGNSGDNFLSGGVGADTLDGGSGNDTLAGDSGENWASYATATSGVTVNLDVGSSRGSHGNDLLLAIGNLETGSGNDSLLGNVHDNGFKAGNGADTLNGGDGRDTLNGGDGWDVLLGADGNDWLHGGAGSPQAVFLSAEQNPLPVSGIDFYAKPVFVDLDNDGDLDLVVGRGDGRLSSFRRNLDGSYTSMDGAGGNPANPFGGIDVGFFSAPTFSDFDLNGTLDLVVGGDDGFLAAYRRNADGSYTVMNGLGGNPANPFSNIGGNIYSAPCFNDLDLDGDQDLIVGNFNRFSAFRRNADGSYTPMDGRFGNPANPFLGMTVGVYSTPSFVDLDDDGDADLVVGGADGTLAAFRRNANGFFSPMDGLNGNPANPFAGIDAGSNSSPIFADMNGDSIPDLILGSSHASLSLFIRSTSNTSRDSLAGGNGADTLDGADGTDTLAGGSGDDIFITSDNLDLIIEASGGGADTIITSVSMSLPNHVEALQIAADVTGVTITGGAGHDVLVGNAVENKFIAGAGNDLILGGNGADTLDGADGADTLDGGSGNDIFLLTDTLDLIIEASGGGADTIVTSVSMNLPENVEALHIAANVSGITITGGAGHDVLVGNGLSNSLNGGAGDDVILTGSTTLADLYALFTT